MKPLLILMSLCLFLQAEAQSSRKDSGYYYILLTQSQKIYSSILQLKFTNTGDKYLEVDDQRQVPIATVSRFRCRAGDFITVPGSAGTDLYKVEREGSKISLYSQVIYDPVHIHDSGYAPSRVYYFRKPGQEKMQIVTYPGLQDAMADDPASLHELQLARTNFKLGMGITFGSLVVEAIGLYMTFKGKPGPAQLSQPAPPPIINGVPQLPPLPPGPSHPLSPLVVVGAGGFVGGLVIAFGAHKHEIRAYEMYNK